MIKPNYQAEQAVIGDILLEPERVLPQALLKLNGEEFGTGEFKVLFQACRELFREGKPVDAVTVLAKAGEAYKPVVLAAAENTPTISNFEQYIDIVGETYRRKKAWEHTASLMELLEGGDIDGCKKEAGEISKALLEENRIRALDAKEGFLNFLERKDSPKEYIKTGLSKLDQTAFIDIGDYVVIGGAPSSGKTALTLQLMTYMARRRKVLYFSLETSAEKILDRVLSNYACIPFSEVKQNGIKDWDSIVERYDEFKKLKFEVVEAAGWTVDQVKAYAVQKQAQIIFVDYLSLLKSYTQNLYEKVTNISIDLHTLAQQNHITVIALSQLNRAGRGEPTMASLRESGQIEQDADCILLLNQTNPDDQCSDRDLIIAKNKEGSTGKIRLAFHGQYQLFTEVETRYGNG